MLSGRRRVPDGHRRRFACYSVFLLALLVPLFLISFGGTTKDQIPDVPDDLNEIERKFFGLPSGEVITAFTWVGDIKPIDAGSSTEDRVQNIRLWNALRSWTRLQGFSRIVTFVPDAASCALINAKLAHITCEVAEACLHPVHDQPTLDCLVSRAIELSTTEHVMFVNGDLIFLDDLPWALQSILANSSASTVLFGRRTDLTVSSAINFASSAWQKELLLAVNSTGRLHDDYGIDYFVMNRKLLRELRVPPFLVASWRWDNWLASELILRGDISTVDLTPVAIAVNQEEASRVGSKNRTGGAWEYNHNLAEQFGVKRWRIGTSGSADLRAVGERFGSIALERNPQNRHSVLLFRHAQFSATRSPAIALLAVGSRDGGLVDNWLCWAQRINFRNFVLLAEDRTVYESLRVAGLDNVVLNNNGVEATDEAARQFADAEWRIVAAEDLVNVALAHGVDVLLDSVHAVWYQDPLKYIEEACDIEVHNATTPGTIIVRSTFHGRALWKAVTKCRDEQREESVAACFRAESTSDKLSRRGVTQCLLDQNLFPSAAYLFEEHGPQLGGYWPVVVREEPELAVDRSRSRLVSWNLWALNDAGACVAESPQVHSPVQADKSTPTGFSLKIRVLVMDRYHNLENLLRSLAEADYDGDTVQLEISVDHPPEGASDETYERRNKSLDIAHAFEWKAGYMRIVDHTENQGLIKQWIRGWTPASPTEVLAVLEDDITVSKYFYLWIKKAVQVYWLDPSNYDSRLYGFALQKPRQAVGERRTWRYFFQDIDTVVGRESPFYLWQQVGTWGALFFPQQWKEFVGWYDARMAVNSHWDPCTPSLVSNRWYKLKPKNKIWSIFHTRFTFERGYYAMYFNFLGWANNTALASNNYSTGLNFVPASSNGSDPWRKSQDLAAFPPPSDDGFYPATARLRIFDLHFSNVARSVLPFRHGLISGLSPTEMCTWIK